MSRELNVVARPAADRPDQLRPVRRSTPSVSVGGVLVGSAHPIVVQSMTNTDTADAAGTAAQVAHLARAGSQLVRVTVNNDAAAAAIPEIVQRLADDGLTTPIVGDFHYGSGGVAGPIGIAVGVSAAASQLGFVGLLHLAALLSANLAVLNLLPIPPLDGGRVAALFLRRLLGEVRGRRVERQLVTAGAVLMLALFAWISLGDILNLFGVER